jgi:hypothetical protein
MSLFKEKRKKFQEDEKSLLAWEVCNSQVMDQVKNCKFSKATDDLR